LEQTFMKGMRATQTAFNQVKVVCEAVANETKEVRETLNECAGIIEGSTYLP